MAVRVLVAVTDHDWAMQLGRMPELAEVNFWSPSPRPFRALGAGELFLFKLKAHHGGLICGGGVFAHATIMPCSLAWRTFGEANGAKSYAEMRERIARLRDDPIDRLSDFEIGCRILTQPSFWPRHLWMNPPADWHPQIVTFATYDTDSEQGRALWNQATERMALSAVAPPPGLIEPPGARYGTPTLVVPRLGQGAFRAVITDAYARRCAITRERTLPALEAAHIRPYADGGGHEARNGLLLRRDLHSLFDDGYVTITPGLRVEVSRRIKEEFENGRAYYAMHGGEIAAPDRPEWRPDRAALAWHNEKRFRG